VRRERGALRQPVRQMHVLPPEPDGEEESEE
jgi:hypothetical protein